MRDTAPYIFMFLSMMGGLIAFGAIEAHLANKHGYLFAFTVGIFESVIGASLVAILIYRGYFLVLFVYDLLIELSNRIRGPKKGG